MSHIVVLIGSLRASSLNRKLAELAVKIAPESVKIDIIEGLDQIPFYNQDLDTDAPPLEVEKLRSEILNSDAILVVTPENNGTLPAVLKNAVDWISRPYGNGAIKNKPFAVMGTSFGADGGVKGLEESARSLTIAGGEQIDIELLAIPFSRFNGAEPEQNEELAAQIRHVVTSLDRHV